MKKEELDKMIKKESERVIKNMNNNPHEPSAAEAMILLMESERKIREKELEKNNN